VKPIQKDWTFENILGRTESVVNEPGGIKSGDTIAVAVKLATEDVGLDENEHLRDFAKWTFGSKCQRPDRYLNIRPFPGLKPESQSVLPQRRLLSPSIAERGHRAGFSAGAKRTKHMDAVSHARNARHVPVAYMAEIMTVPVANDAR